MSGPAIFALLDEDKCGAVTLGEIEQIIERSGCPGVSAAQLQELVSDMDVDGDGIIDEDEFGAWFEANVDRRQVLEQYHAHVHARGEEQKRVQRFASLESYLDELRSKFEIKSRQFTVEYVRQTFDTFDTDRSGTIEPDEFERICKRLGDPTMVPTSPCNVHTAHMYEASTTATPSVSRLKRTCVCPLHTGRRAWRTSKTPGR
jgi:Ca2+-binding EF-hand superfamily protein